MTAFSSLASVSRIALRDNATAAADAQYGYIPTESTGIFFLALFGISTTLHITQAAYYRTWWLLPTAALCGVGELLGWSGRLWSITSTIIAPTPLLAASFIIFSRMIQQLGQSYSLLTPRWYARLFLPCDLIALVVQGVGGGMASSADTLAGANVGAHVMLGGICFQFVAIIVFSTLGCDYMRRYLRDRPLRPDSRARGVLTPRLKLMLAALAFSTAVLIVRSVYRIVELVGGWEGSVIRTEVYFVVFDGGMVVLALFTLNFAHPGRLLRLAPFETKHIALENMDDSHPLVTLVM
ncbi:RTA1 like protein-domain-containing protein [Mycena rosella]|uniref:RTA1 like protein-domain-containing protein n=1 Tax=Mycena rosella TaxID=1033263 RepID=A0AAD7DGI3_MYCRO|nr:RTA1 like protein-domain-containing protein [Mycena rosella]